jgi:16S rRNA (guanine527-N7)-methyltransferase
MSGAATSAQPPEFDGLSLGDDVRGGLSRVVEALVGHRRANVSGARGSREAAVRLVGDAVALLDVDEAVVRSAAGARWVDLGTGNGVPGVPLLLVLPAVDMTLVDSVAKKCAFVEQLVRELGVGGRARVVCARSEHVTALGAASREAFDVALAKAVGPLATVVELAAPLLQVGGVLLAHKSARQAEREWAGGGGARAPPGPAPPPRGREGL